MAQFEKWFTQDLTHSIEIRHCEQITFTGDNLSNVIGVNLFVDGEPYDGGGDVTATVVLSNGATVALEDGVLNGNKASVTLTSGCFICPGLIGVYIRLTNGDVKTTVLSAVFTVIESETGSAVDPGTIIPSVQDLIDDIADAVATIPPDYSALLATIAPTFSAITAYSGGSYVWYDSVLYRFTANHAAGAWTGTDATAVVVGDELNNAVRYDAAQTLTDAQKAQARTNVGAAGAAETTSAIQTEAAARDQAIADKAVRYDTAQSLTDAQKAQARGNIAAASLIQSGATVAQAEQNGTTYRITDAGLEGRVNSLHNLIDYGYSAPLDGAGVSAGSLRMTRMGTRYTLNATYSSSSTPQKIILQETPQGYTSSFPSGQTPLTLVNGHKYRLHMFHVSGTATNTVAARFYAGTISAVGSDTRIGEHQYSDILYDTTTYENGLYACIYVSKASTGNTLTNYTCDIVLEDITDAFGISVSGATPSITAEPDTRYVCTAAYVETLSFTPSATGICSVRFVSGTTATVLTLPNTVKMPDWWTGVEASRTYEISIADGVYGAVGVWT